MNMGKVFPVGVSTILSGEWTYCCRCDKEGIMVPKSPRHWECVQCGLSIIAERVERDIYLADQPVTPEEGRRHIVYCQRIAKAKLDAMNNPPPMAFRMKIVALVARLLGVKTYRQVGGK